MYSIGFPKGSAPWTPAGELVPQTPVYPDSGSSHLIYLRRERSYSWEDPKSGHKTGSRGRVPWRSPEAEPLGKPAEYPHPILHTIPVMKGYLMEEREYLEGAYAYCETLPIKECNGCDGCGLRCAEGVPMTRLEYLAIREYLGSLVSEEVEKILSQDKEVSLGDGFYTIACEFREMGKNRCFVYPARPLVCRLFGLVSWLPCPIERVPLAHEDALRLFQEYARFERHTFREWSEI